MTIGRRPVPIADLIRRLVRSRFLRFALVGAAGALVDIGALYLARDAFGLDLYTGRVFSFLCAVSFTFFANRIFTFGDAKRAHLARQWLVFATSQLGGLAVNYALYALLVTYWPLAHDEPAIAVVIGSLAGLVFNYAAARRLVFRAG